MGLVSLILSEKSAQISYSLKCFAEPSLLPWFLLLDHSLLWRFCLFCSSDVQPTKPTMQVKFQNDQVRRASSPRSRKLGKKWRSTGSVFPLPTGCLWDCGLRQDPCLGPVAAPEGQNFSPVLSPSDYKWQKRFHQGKKYNFANSTAMPSPPHGHGRATLECFFPWQPLHSYPQGQAQSPPHKGDKQRLLLLATTPISTETWLCGAFGA